jgi:hypothetical protein
LDNILRNSKLLFGHGTDTYLRPSSTYGRNWQELDRFRLSSAMHTTHQRGIWTAVHTSIESLQILVDSHPPTYTHQTKTKTTDVENGDGVDVHYESVSEKSPRTYVDSKLTISLFSTPWLLLTHFLPSPHQASPEAPRTVGYQTPVFTANPICAMLLSRKDRYSRRTCAGAHMSLKDGSLYGVLARRGELAYAKTCPHSLSGRLPGKCLKSRASVVVERPGGRVVSVVIGAG